MLDNLHTRSMQVTQTRELIAANRDRHQLFAWARATQLAGFGRYQQAEDDLLSTEPEDRLNAKKPGARTKYPVSAG